jgi:hypothetical protein
MLPSWTHWPTQIQQPHTHKKQTPPPVRPNPLLPALFTQTNKQTNKIGIPETHGSHNHPFKASISRNSTTYHHSHHPSIASILLRQSLSSPIGENKTQIKKIKGRNKSHSSSL